jgi:hypothetical protein
VASGICPRACGFSELPASLRSLESECLGSAYDLGFACKPTESRLPCGSEIPGMYW